MADLDKFATALNTDEAVRKTFERIAAKGGDKVDILLATAKECGFNVSREELSGDKVSMSASELDEVAGGAGDYTCSRCGKKFTDRTTYIIHEFAHMA